MHTEQLLQPLIGLVLGLVLGAAFFLGLRANTRLYLGTGLGAALAVHAARLLGSTGAFLAIAILLPAGLAPALLGFTVAGFVTSRRAATAGTP